MTDIKICGLKNRKSVEAAVNAGARYLGFVFAESPRRIEPRIVRKLTKDLPERVKKIGVFVSPEKDEAEEMTEEAGLDMIQIHGETDLTELSRPIIRAFSIKNQDPLYFGQYPHLLLDAPPAKLMGGNGQTFDWNLADRHHLPKEKLWLAGGLTIENVTEAIRFFQPQVVDISSGVETAGQKDIAKIHAFCQVVKATDAEG